MATPPKTSTAAAKAVARSRGVFETLLRGWRSGGRPVRFLVIFIGIAVFVAFFLYSFGKNWNLFGQPASYVEYFLVGLALAAISIVQAYMRIRRDQDFSAR